MTVYDTAEIDLHLTSEATPLRGSLEAAVELGGRPVHRLGAAGTSVTFRVADAPELSATLLLDRIPPAVADGDEPAEVTIEMDAEQAHSFARGQLLIPNLLLGGQLAASGPVRKYLALDPILRSLLARAQAAAEE